MRERAAPHTAVHEGKHSVYRYEKQSRLSAHSTGSLHKSQSIRKSRVSAKYVLIGLGIYNSFLWPDRASRPNSVLFELLKLQHSHLLIFKGKSNEVVNENSWLCGLSF